MFGAVRTEAYRRYYRYRTLRQVLYDINTSTGHFGKFRTIWISVPVQTFIPAPDTSVSSVQHPYRYRTLREVRYDINTGITHLGKFGTSIPVPDTSVSLVRHQYRYRYGRLYRSRYGYRHNIDTGTGHYGKLGTSTRYRHIVSSLGALAPRIHARKDTHGTFLAFQRLRTPEIKTIH